MTARRRSIRFLCCCFAVLIGGQTALASLCQSADMRAIQWSDAIAHADLLRVKPDGVCEFRVTEVIDGSLSAQQTVIAQNLTPAAATDSAGRYLTDDNLGKNFLLLLRHRRTGGDKTFLIVYVAPADTDASSIAAFADLVSETRKDEKALTDDTVKAQAQALADAQDDTEADQAEQTLRDMGEKAVPAIKQVMASETDIGKERLARVIKDLQPAIDQASTTQPTTAPSDTVSH